MASKKDKEEILKEKEEILKEKEPVKEESVESKIMSEIPKAPVKDELDIPDFIDSISNRRKFW